MSIATEIQRLQSAKTSLATAISNKGVTVPSSTKLDGYASLVNQIETGGGGLVHLGSFPTQTLTFAETNFATWTPTSSASTMLSGKSVGTFVATDITNTEYYTRVRIRVNVAYKDGTATSKGRLEKVVAEQWFSVDRRSSTRNNMLGKVRDANIVESISNTWLTEYYNSSWTMAYSMSYGFYPSTMSSLNLSSSTAKSPTVTLYRPQMTMRCSATYFSTAMAANVDQDASTITFAFDYYRIDGGYQRKIINESFIDMWHNGLQ